MPRSLLRRISLLILLAVIPASGCVWLRSVFLNTPGEVRYERTPEANLKLGEQNLASKDFPSAQRYFEYVKTKYPYLDQAKVAELRLADIDYDRGQYAEARERYNNFVRLHPGNPKVDYAAFRAALTNVQEIPSNFFLVPSPSQKDQVPINAANNSLRGFIENYPTSRFLPEAQKELTAVKRRLVQHEFAIADFYVSRKRWPAVVGRLDTIRLKFEGGGDPERVYLGLYEAYVKMSKRDEARQALTEYIVRFPNDAGAAKAKALLAAAQR